MPKITFLLLTALGIGCSQKDQIFFTEKAKAAVFDCNIGWGKDKSKWSDECITADLVAIKSFLGYLPMEAEKDIDYKNWKNFSLKSKS